MEASYKNSAETAVIIPNYNGLRFMEECISALNEQTYTSFRVIVVDNGSTDGSAEYLKELRDSGRCRFRLDNIFLPGNTGFSGAVNTGIAAASDCEYVVLLNNDTSAEPDYLKELIAPFGEKGGENIAAVSPMMIQMYHKEFLDDAGDGYSVLGWGFQRGVGQSVTTAKFAKRTRIFSACAGACAYRRSVLEEISFKDDANADAAVHISDAEAGGRTSGAYFDPMHFAYLEDIDVSFRINVLGKRIVYEPRSKVYHVGSGTSGSRYNDFKVRLSARNSVYLNYKNMPLLMLVINLPGIMAGTIIKQLFFIKRGFGKAYFKGLVEGLRTLKAVRKHKTFFKEGRIFTYIRIEWMLIKDTFSYMQDLIVRKTGKQGG